MPDIGTKQKWTLMLVLSGILVVAALIGGLVGRGNAESEETGVRVRIPEARMGQQEMRERLNEAQNQQLRDYRRETEQVIEEHYARVQMDPDAPEAPALLLAMGNLHRRLFNYEEAIWCYQQILVRYPDWDGKYMAYGQLATCYEEMGDHSNTLRVYMDIMREFPEESEEHQLARAQLGL